MHEVIDVPSSVFRDGHKVSPNLDHVWGDEHENDLKSYFKVICKAKFKVKGLGSG